MKRGKIKSLISLSLVLVLGASLMIGCSKGSEQGKNEDKSVENFNKEGRAIVNEPIIIKALAQVDPLSKDFNEMEILKNFDDGTNIDVQYECVAGNVWEEKKNLILASGEVPDIFFGGGLSNSDIAKYGSMGTFVAMENYIDKYAPNIKKLFEENPEFKKQSTAADGHIYILPYIDGYKPEDTVNHLFINKKWLDKLGLEIPKTIDEYEKVLKAFKDKDPNGNGKNDEIPLSFRAKNVYNGDFSLSGSFGVIDGLEHVLVKNEKIIFSATDNGYKEYIKWANRLYTQGLMDSEVFTQEQGMYTSKGKENTLGSFLSYNSDPTVGLERADDYIALEPLKGPNGDQLWGNYVKDNRGAKFVITNANKNIEATIRWVDQFFNQEDDKTVEVHIGQNGVITEKEGDKFKVVNPDNKAKWENCPGPYAPGIVSVDTYSNKMIQSATQIKKNSFYEQYKPFLGEQLPILSFTKEELDKIGTMKTDLNNYVDEMKAKWVTGQADVEKDWDGYIDRLNKMGVEDYIKIYNDAFDRYQMQK
ncbi:extracellular solute-binding protein [Clostridium carnis]